MTKNPDPDKFEEFFEKATEFKPYPYQRRRAESDPLPSCLNIPTGAGKTAAVILAWLWRRRFHTDENVRSSTPRRLIYCLPMRVLVEQTRDNAILWLHRLDRLGGKVELEGEKGKEKVKSYAPSWEDPKKIAVTVLMGAQNDAQTLRNNIGGIAYSQASY